MSGPMGSSAGVGAGVDLKDSEEVNIVWKLTKRLTKSLDARFHIGFFQVKEYLENLGVEYRFENKYLPSSVKDYRFGCYHEKDPAACHLLGDYWEGIKKDFIKVSSPRPTVFLH